MGLVLAVGAGEPGFSAEPLKQQRLGQTARCATQGCFGLEGADGGPFS